MTERDPRQLDLFSDGGGARLQPMPPKQQAAEALPAPASPQGDCHHGNTLGQVLRFPVDVWAPRLWQPKVEKVARLLCERKTERGRSNLWRNTVNSLFSQMARRGATAAEIEQQIHDFHGAVSWQLSDQQSGPGAA